VIQTGRGIERTLIKNEQIAQLTTNMADSEEPLLMPTDATVTDSVMLVLSHVVILLAVFNALYRCLYYVAATMGGMFLNSTLFHMCRANWTCGMYGVALAYDSSSFALYRTRVVDHASANHAVVAMLFSVLTSDPAGGPTVGGLRILLLIGTFVAELAFPLKATAIVVAFCVLAAVMSVYVWISKKGDLPDESRFGLGLLALALMILGAGYIFFSVTTISYGIAHSLWHVCVGLAVFLITEGIHIGRGGRSWLEQLLRRHVATAGII